MNDDNYTPHDELVERVRPFVRRYVQAKPQVVTTWFSNDLPPLEKFPAMVGIMADFWEWIRHGEGVDLFTNSTQRDLTEAFEDVLREIRDSGQMEHGE